MYLLPIIIGVIVVTCGAGMYSVAGVRVSRGGGQAGQTVGKHEPVLPPVNILWSCQRLVQSQLGSSKESGVRGSGATTSE